MRCSVDGDERVPRKWAILQHGPCVQGSDHTDFVEEQDERCLLCEGCIQDQLVFADSTPLFSPVTLPKTARHNEALHHILFNRNHAKLSCSSAKESFVKIRLKADLLRYQLLVTSNIGWDTFKDVGGCPARLVGTRQLACKDSWRSRRKGSFLPSTNPFHRAINKFVVVPLFHSTVHASSGLRLDCLWFLRRRSFGPGALDWSHDRFGGLLR
mmetsp:Transcript_35358/g.52591  ORF Transcript_35358/g.52591 Transcript_35358/m.52591 type:complete len:212 (+) Transcript_35358:1369-2004(+)